MTNKDIKDDITKKQQELESLYLKKMKDELKEIHLISKTKKEIARLFTKLNQKENS